MQFDGKYELGNAQYSQFPVKLLELGIYSLISENLELQIPPNFKMHFFSKI